MTMLRTLPLPPPWPGEPTVAAPQVPTTNASTNMEDFWKYLMALGFGMAASKDRSGIVRIGEGGKHALTTLLGLEKEAATRQDQAATRALREQALEVERENIRARQPLIEAQAAYYNARARTPETSPNSNNTTNNDPFSRAFTLIENVNRNYENLISREYQRLNDPLLSPQQRTEIQQRINALDNERRSRIDRLYRFYSNIMPPELRPEFEAIFGNVQSTPQQSTPTGLRIIDAIPSR